MVAKLKLKGIDGRAPQEMEPAGPAVMAGSMQVVSVEGPISPEPCLCQQRTSGTDPIQKVRLGLRRESPEYWPPRGAPGPSGVMNQR